jgi:hypothetical protein
MNPSKLLMRMLAFAGVFGMYIDDPAGGGGAPTPPAPAPRAPEPETFSKDYVRELREESKGYRLKLSETEAQKKALEEKATADETAAQAKIAEASKAADQRIIRAELKAAALKAGMVDLDGLKLADLSKVTLDDKGEVQGADALMDEMKKAKPYLFGAASSSSNKQPPNPNPPGDKKVTDLSPAEYAAARAAAIKKR